MSQHKLIFHRILFVLLFNFLSRQNFCFLPVSSVVTCAFMLQQVLLGVDIQLTNLVAISTFFVSTDLLHSSYVLSRHAIFCRDIALLLYSVLCVVTEEILS